MAIPVGTGDFNNDGKLDVIGAGNGIAVLLGNGDGTFGLPVNSPTSSPVSPLTNLAVADFNQDKNLDVAVAITTNTLPYSQVAVFWAKVTVPFRPAKHSTSTSPKLRLRPGT